MAQRLPECRILENVPRIGFDVHTCPLPGSLHSFLQYTGNKHDYDYLMGVTGAPFRRLWHRDDSGNVDMLMLGGEPLRRVFDALGYRWHLVRAEKDTMKAAVRESIAADLPVISFGILGPPEAGLVTGYARDGEVFYGWSYFQAMDDRPFTRDRYYETDAWFDTIEPQAGHGLLVVDNASARRRDPRLVLYASLSWAVNLERTRRRVELPEHVCGLDAYEAWAAGLETDADYEGDMQLRVRVHGDQCTMLDERRHAAGYLRKMADAARECSIHMLEAADRFDRIAVLVNDAWPFPPDYGPAARDGLANPETRRTIAEVVREAGTIEADAVADLERAIDAFRP